MIVGASLSACGDVLSCALLLIALFTIKVDFAAKVKGVINIRSQAILCISYCAFVFAILLEDISLLKL